MAITPQEKKEIERQVDAWLINIMIRYGPEDLAEVAEIIRQEVEDMLESEIAERAS